MAKMGRQSRSLHPADEIPMFQAGVVVWPLRYRFGQILEWVLNWPDPASDIGLTELHRGWGVLGERGEALRDVPMAVTFLRRLADAYMAGRLDLDLPARTGVSLAPPSREVEDEAAALDRVYNRARALRLVGLRFGAASPFRTATGDVRECYMRRGLESSTRVPMESLPAVAAEELYDVLLDPRFGLGRCPAPQPNKQSVPVCDRWFLIRRGHRQRRFCSDACRQRAGRRRRGRGRTQRLYGLS